MKQVFSYDQLEKDVTIKVEVKNISASPVFLAGITRYFDDAIDNTFSGDIADRTADSVTSRESNGLSLTAVTDFPVTSVQVYGASNWNACSQSSVGTPTGQGDWVGRVYIPLGCPARR